MRICARSSKSGMQKLATVDVMGELYNWRGFSSNGGSATLVAAHQGDNAPGSAPRRYAPVPMFGEWLSLVEHLVRDQGVGGSNPLSPTIFINNLQQFSPDYENHCRRFCSGQSLQVQQTKARSVPPLGFSPK